LERGDLDVFYRALDPDVEWRAWNDEGNCHGRDEVMAAIRSALEGGVAVEVPPHVDAGDKLVLMPREMPPFFPPDAKGCFKSWRSVTVRSWRSATSSTETTRWPLRASELTRRTTHQQGSHRSRGQRERSTLVPSGFGAKGTFRFQPHF
jgi:hypothetical protein